MSITQEEYDKHDALLQEQCVYMNNNNKYNDTIYEREWEWCRVACSANRSLAPAFHDFIKEVESQQSWEPENED